jgi:hypothetical protein
LPQLSSGPLGCNLSTMTKPEKHPILDIENPDQAFHEFSRKVNQLRNDLIRFGLEYTNKITGRPFDNENDKYILLRESILFRANSLLFHLNLLVNIQKMHIDNLKKTKFNSSDRSLLILDSREQQIFLFDSIIFHSISLFDYLGNLIDYVCSSKKQMNLKWNGVVRSIRDKANSMFQSPASEIILSLNNEFVGLLYQHRSDLIHYKTDLGAAKSSFNLMTAESNFTVFAPKKFITRFSHLKHLSKSNELTLIYVSFWLIDQTFDSLDKILRKLFEHIETNRKIAKGKEVFVFMPPNKPVK